MFFSLTRYAIPLTFHFTIDVLIIFFICFQVTVAMALTNAERRRKYREKRDNEIARRAEYLRKKKKNICKTLLVVNANLLVIYRIDHKLSKETKEGTTKTSQRKKGACNSFTSTYTWAWAFTQISSSKRRERSRAKCYRDNKKLRKELEIENKMASKYMNRWLRVVEKTKRKGWDTKN